MTGTNKTFDTAARWRHAVILRRPSRRRAVEGLMRRGPAARAIRLVNFCGLSANLERGGRRGRGEATGRQDDLRGTRTQSLADSDPQQSAGK